MRRAAIHDAYVRLQYVREYAAANHGRLTDSLPEVMEMFHYTNSIWVGDKHLTCIIAMRWKSSSAPGPTLALTQDGTAIWFERGREPRIVSFDERCMK